ncbi:alkaline phosphatase PafA [Limnovirga soli]|uniref:Alkaline phosphatase family protein n=1 Tax=Limnovirga soli TaxID=2656915 RepID=A0A8J8FG15_9BACT|nr:alkaline phosphatase PafA [Limnovirga soli]NNV55186.1 alkaline phosphatase family protein [Limnovirga soli]
MKRTHLLILLLFCSFYTVYSQQNTLPAADIARPKLVVGIVIDQMRWDYLYRYNKLFKANGGFKRMLNNGFTCENTFIPYTPTVTAVGHSSIYTGSVPAINGMVGNSWYDQLLKKSVYCTDDDSVSTVGSTNKTAGEMSPKNLYTTTITDELRLATNFKSKVIGVAIKDRGAILPAGHAANAAYWYDSKTGNFITSTYYMNALPAWVNNFNNRKVTDSLYQFNWDIAMDKAVYPDYCTEDQKPYESKPLGKDQLGFPYNLSQFVGKDYGKISVTPYGNTLTLEMAKAATISENMGKSAATDFLAVSLSTPDYIGHSFGPNSWEQLDDFIRLDEELGKFFNFLDATVGKGQYTVFLSADHGVAHIADFLKENKIPAGTYNFNSREVNTQLKQVFGVDNLILAEDNYQIYLNHNAIDSASLDDVKITNWLAAYLKKQPGIANAFALNKMAEANLNAKQKEMLSNGYNALRSGDFQFILKPGFYDGGSTGTTHGLWNPYDSHIPLLWYGWGIKHGATNRETYMTDIASTLAALLHIQMPSGCVGHVIEEVIKK